MTPIEAALEEIESLKPGKSFSDSAITKKHNVHRSTLSRRHRAVTSSRAAKAISQQKISPEQEIELVRYIKELAERGIYSTRQMVRNFASNMAKETVSESWVTRFINQNSIHLISPWIDGMDNNRHQANSGAEYRHFFDLLSAKINQYDIKPRHTYNMDEKGFLIGVTGRSKRVFSRKMWEKNEEEEEVREAIQDGSREWITLLACVCADGSALPPSLIYKSANKGIQSSWVEQMKPEEHSVHFTASPSGGTNNDVSFAWLKQVFDRYTKKKARQSYRLLILDGHGSHVTMDFIRFCAQNKILLAVLPSHSTHTLQPLDVIMFKALLAAYSTELSNHLFKGQGLLSIKDDFFLLFWKAWVSSFKKTTILKSFEATGISPLNPDVILKRFINATPDEQESQESSTSILNASGRRKIDRLVHAAVKDTATDEAKELRLLFYSLHIQHELLCCEKKRLQKALDAERQKEHSESLELQQRQEYHGGAVTRSTRKAREAQARQAIKECEEKEQQHQKSERKRQREMNKERKEQLREEKRVERETAKPVKEKEKAELVTERSRKKEAQNAGKALQLPQKGKRPASEPPNRVVKRRKQAVDAVHGDKSPGAAASPAPPVATRCGRKVKSPSKYK